MRKILLPLIALLLLSVLACDEEENNVDHIYIQVSPNKKEYWEDEELNLDGLVVTIWWEDNNYIDISHTEFENYNLISVPAHGEKLQPNVNEFKIIHSPSGISTTEDIKVWNKAISLENVVKISDTPFNDPSSCIVRNDTLFVISEDKGLHVYDFITEKWSLINSNFALHHYHSKQGFIREDKWYVPVMNGGCKIFEYDFKTKYGITNSSLGLKYSTSGSGTLYSNNELYFFDYSDWYNSANKGILHKYDFENDTVIKVTENNGINYVTNYASTFKNTIHINNEDYVLIGSFGRSPNVFKFDKSTEKFEEQTIDNLSPLEHADISGVNFSYKDYIVYGLGNRHAQHNYFFYINTKTNQGGRVYNEFYETRERALMFEYNGDIYILGGYTEVGEDEFTYRTTLEKLIFSEM